MHFVGFSSDVIMADLLACTSGRPSIGFDLHLAPHGWAIHFGTKRTSQGAQPMSGRSCSAACTLFFEAKERTIPALYDRIGRALDTFELSEFPNYFRNSGYAPT